jgi:hypothetical protein
MKQVVPLAFPANCQLIFNGLHSFTSQNTEITLHKPTVSEKRVLRRIFGPKRGKVTGGWRQLHSEEHHNSHPLPNIIGMLQ